MTTICVREASSSSHIYEYEVARRWFALPAGVRLPLNNGDSCQLLFTGRPGGAAGPDVQDAILLFSAHDEPSVGEVEFHVRSSDWFAHQHHADPRYNSVLLHVVLICDHAASLLRQDGTALSMCSLYDVPLTGQRSTTLWPCQDVTLRRDDAERSHRLKQAGLLRFEQKAYAFVEHIHQMVPHGPFSAYDSCLIVALAEGLGYGRDRAFFRAAGQYLLGLTKSVPEPLGRASDPTPLDAQRLAILRRLVAQWRTTGAWHAMRDRIRRGGGDEALQALRTIFVDLGTARADILICNVVLPFAMAVALIENDTVLAERAQRLYIEHPGLSSNRITRAMCRQLQLPREPRGACQQQGLHYIYQQTCREKRCEVCMLGQRRL